MESVVDDLIFKYGIVLNFSDELKQLLLTLINTEKFNNSLVFYKSPVDKSSMFERFVVKSDLELLLYNYLKKADKLFLFNNITESIKNYENFIPLLQNIIKTVVKFSNISETSDVLKEQLISDVVKSFLLFLDVSGSVAISTIYDIIKLLSYKLKETYQIDDENYNYSLLNSVMNEHRKRKDSKRNKKIKIDK